MRYTVQYASLLLRAISTFSFYCVIQHIMPLATARLVSYDDHDPAITWLPNAIQPTELCAGNPDRPACDGFWWLESNDADSQGSTHQSWGPNTSFSFSFKGGSFMIFGPLLWVGAGGTVVVDGKWSGSFSTVDRNGGRVPKQVLWMQTGLDETREHTVVVSYDNKTYGSTHDTKRWLGIDFVVVDQISEIGASETTQGASVAVTVTATVTVTSEVSSLRGTSLALVISIPILAVLVMAVTIFLIILAKRKRGERILVHQKNRSWHAAYPEVISTPPFPPPFLPTESTAPPTDVPTTALSTHVLRDGPAPPYRKARI